MDSITHGLLAFLLLGGFFDWRLGGYVAFIGAMPDFDIFLLPISGKYPSLRHRSIVHSIPFMALLPPLMAFLTTLTIFFIFSLNSLFWFLLYFLILYFLGTVAYGLHLLVDCLTFYGAPLLWPMKKDRVKYDIFGTVSAWLIFVSIGNLTMLVISMHIFSTVLFPICYFISVISYLVVFSYYITLKIKKSNQKKQERKHFYKRPYYLQV